MKSRRGTQHDAAAKPIDYRSVYENLPLMCFTLREDATVLGVNSFGASELGYEPEELLGQPVLAVFHEEDRPGVEQQIRKAFECLDEVMRWEFRKVRKNGQVIWVRESVRAVRAPNGELVLLVVCEDATERLATERKVIEYSNKLRDLSEQLTLTEERERERIATVLHDEIAQSLGAAVLRVGQLAGKGDPELARQLEPIQELLQTSTERTRKLTTELSTIVLKRFGLVSAVEELGQRLAKSHGFGFSMQTADGLPRLTTKTETIVYRCVRELLWNVVKHADAKQVSVSMEQTAGELRIRLTDDGKGFDPDNLSPTAGIGLFSVREHLEYSGGRLDLISRKGGGTGAILVVPF